MSVTVRIPTILRTYTDGRAEVPAEGTTLSEVIADLDRNHAGIGPPASSTTAASCAAS
ncbi:hypothetical protein GCM10020000_33870 [Streptomyces olivoverticillatus]